MKTLDRIALVLIALAVVFLGLLTVHGPFARGLIFGAVFAAAYGYKTQQRDLVKIAIFAPLLYAAAWSWGALAIYKLTPHTIDAELLRLDCGIGVAVWHWCAAHPFSMTILNPVYYGLGLMLSLGMCFTDRRTALVRAVILSAVGGFTCYYLFPACGPRYIGELVAPRNAMPSLHLTWALLFTIYANKYARWPLMVFAALTAIATMATGEHYAIDLVAAVPFTWAIVFITSQTYAKPLALPEPQSLS